MSIIMWHHMTILLGANDESWLTYTDTDVKKKD